MPLTLDQAIDKFKVQLAEIGPYAFANYPDNSNPEGFAKYLLDNQNKISGGFINPGRTQDQKMVMYGDDKKAYDVDLATFNEVFMMDTHDDGSGLNYHDEFTLSVLTQYSNVDGSITPAAITAIISGAHVVVPSSLVDNTRSSARILSKVT